MKIDLLTAAIAAVVTCAAAGSVMAKEKPAAANSLRAIQIECLKQYGGVEDPQTKKFTLAGGTLTEFQSRVDAIYACVAQKTGKPATPFITSRLTVG